MYVCMPDTSNISHTKNLQLTLSVKETSWHYTFMSYIEFETQK
jgi:hypothetical protein